MMASICRCFLLAIIFNPVLSFSHLLLESSAKGSYWGKLPASVQRASSAVAVHLFGKIFEEEGPLGKGITVGKVQVALNCRDRSKDSILALLERESQSSDDSPYALAQLAHEVCLTLLRKSDDWVAACSESTWFSGNDAGKAESKFNTLANKEAAKFEKEYFPSSNSDSEKPGGPTLVVVSLILEIQGDATKFEGAGFSLAGTKDVLNSIAADCLVEDGECVNAAEVFWTPGDREEVLTSRDLIADFPELITL